MRVVGISTIYFRVEIVTTSVNSEALAPQAIVPTIYNRACACASIYAAARLRVLSNRVVAVNTAKETTY